MIVRVPSMVNLSGLGGLGADCLAYDDSGNCMDYATTTTATIDESSSGNNVLPPMTPSDPAGEFTGAGSGVSTTAVNGGTPGVSMQACSAAGGTVLSDSTGALQCYASPTGNGQTLVKSSNGSYVPLSTGASIMNALAANTQGIIKAITGTGTASPATAGGLSTTTLLMLGIGVVAILALKGKK